MTDEQIKQNDMNDQNLITPSSSEAREWGRAGGIASGIARREKKQLRELLEEAGEKLITNKDGEKLPKVVVAAIQLVNKAAKGDLKALRLYAELTGQLTTKVEVEQCPPPVIANIFADRG